MRARSGGRVYAGEGWLSRTGAIVEDPIYRWTGRASTPVLVEQPRGQEGSPGAIRITVQAEEYVADRDRAQRMRMTHASQLDFDPGDRGLIEQAKLSQAKQKWGILFFNQVKGE